eukprot:TRINITY_DN12937_c0_g1_i1.p1 TRINITY_DN12937_c0_g1~~TRINITY_DN12937_c0_g1_i1.p1  ORF type:complete len:456 (-),score=102.36 TRINITY_DN12937_c0_g1_i1:108-1475(-)
MLPSVFFLDNTGFVILEKHFSGEPVPRKLCELFWSRVISSYSVPNEVPPVLPQPIADFYVFSLFRPLSLSPGSKIPVSPKDWVDTASELPLNAVSFGSSSPGLWIVTGLKKEASALAVVEYLQLVHSRLQLYLGDDFSNNSITTNFSTVIQLLDEMFDSGFPFTLYPNQLTDMISPATLPSKVLNTIQGKSAVEDKLPRCVNSSVPWRKSDVKYMSNEVYLDLEETLDVVISPTGDVVTSEISGRIQCNSRLSGSPDCTLRVTNFNLLSNASLHPCVRIHRFRFERVISFIPPDGIFTLLEYTTTGAKNFFPLTITPKIALAPGSSRIKVQLMYNTAEPENIVDVELIIPWPKSTLSASLTTNMGVVDYDPKLSISRWKIGKRHGKERSFSVEGTVTLPSDYNQSIRPTIAVQFKARNMSASGLNIEELTVRNVEYKPYKGARCLTQTGKFFIRT